MPAHRIAAAVPGIAKSLRPANSNCRGGGFLRLPAQLIWLLLAAVMGGAGCGAVSASSALNEANRDLREAQAQQADKYAPYYYTRAESYLQKAKELNGMGQFQVAAEYARVSQEAADKSLEVGKINKEQAGRRDKFAPKKGNDAPGVPKLPGE